MSVTQRRRVLERFTDRLGGDAFEFPEYAREWSSEQGFSVPVSTAIGADYGYDHIHAGVSPRRPAVEKVRFLMASRSDVPEEHVHALPLDTQLDRMHARLHANGHGLLWMRFDLDDTRRWARARLTRAPDISYSGSSRRTVPVSLEFARLSDWYAEDETVVTQNVSASPATVEVENTGNVVVRNAVVELRALGSNGYINPMVTNTITGEWFQANRTGTNSSHRFRADAGRFAAERSTDGGTTWTDDYSSLAIGGTQAGIITLVPGTNILTVSQPSGTPNMQVVVRFHAPYQ